VRRQVAGGYGSHGIKQMMRCEDIIFKLIIWNPDKTVFVPDDVREHFRQVAQRGGGCLLWQNDPGRRVTCSGILLSDKYNTNVQLLYNRAETGVVVEIHP
jgi:hypothetical protein